MLLIDLNKFDYINDGNYQRDKWKGNDGTTSSILL